MACPAGAAQRHPDPWRQIVTSARAHDQPRLVFRGQRLDLLDLG